MNFAKPGPSTSEFEVTNISAHGFWIFSAKTQTEHFLAFEHFPWFENASVAQIREIRLEGQTILHWPLLDIDLDLERIQHPERFPLVAK